MPLGFEIIDKRLVLVYEPVFGIESILERISTHHGAHIKDTFFVTQELLYDSDKIDYYSEDVLKFYIGDVGDFYTEINSDVIGTEHSFYFSNDIVLKSEMFIAYQNISVLRKIDELIERDFYVGGDWELNNGISFEVYMELIKKFPKSTELKKYSQMRIANIIKDYFLECDKYEVIYDKFISKKNKSNVASEVPVSKYNIQIELEQFTVARDELKYLLYCHDIGEIVSEKKWQEVIHNIFQLLYPKYICCAREIKFHGDGEHDKQPDFILVDANGFLDLLEIKKADVRVLTKYRNNYVASREVSGAIQQIEKYIFCLNSSDKAKKDVSKKIINLLPNGLDIQVVNPQGILILGRSNNFDNLERKDFELIKRQYKHLADIMTYDDLLERLNNIINSLQLKSV